MEIKLSITIVAYNNYSDIEKAVMSMEKYTSNKIKKIIYIVDNGASIANKNELYSFRKFIKKFDDIEYIDPGINLGFGKGHNFVLQRLNSEYHAIVNPDIIFIEDAFSKILDWMSTKSDVGCVIPKIVDIDGNLQQVYRKELTVFDMFIRMFCKNLFQKRLNSHTLQDKDYSKPFQVPFGQGSFLVIRTNLLKKLGGFDDNFFMYLEDADLCKRVNQVSKLMYLPDTKVIHKWEKGSHSNKKLFMYHMQSMRYYFKKWGMKWF